KALVVPRSAVLHVGEERVVFVQTGATENGLLKFQRRRVVLEERETDPVPVKTGLQPGEAVVVSGALLLSGLLVCAGGGKKRFRRRSSGCRLRPDPVGGVL